MKAVLYALGAVLGIIVLAFVVGVFTKGLDWGVRWFSAPIEGEVGKRERVYDSDQQLFDYKFFYNTCNKVRSVEAKIQATKSMGDDEITRRTLMGLQARRNDLVAQYNGKAEQTEASGKFQANDLPVRISHENMNTYCGG